VIDIDDIRMRWQHVAVHLDERGRRLFAANEALGWHYGGVTATAEATGLARSTINRGIRELRSSRSEIAGRIRRPGGGRKSAVAHQPNLPAALEALIDDAIRGDPCSSLRWVSRSLRHLVKALAAQGFKASQRVVANLLRELNYSCQANRKTREGANHPDRDAQFAHINAMVKAAISAGEPAISVDTKKKEVLGNLKNAGQTYRPQGDPEKVKTHDFPDPKLGKAVPYGVYDIHADEAGVSVGISHDTAEFAVAAIRRWWQKLGRKRYGRAKRLLVTADSGGSNSSRCRLWKVELQKWADETGLIVEVCHYPPGTSKWNKIEHRVFCHITRNWRGTPLQTLEIVVESIGATTTETGLEVHAWLDECLYEKGRKVSDEELAECNIKRNAYHGEWNYDIHPRVKA
jgi:hypothetical protein